MGTFLEKEKESEFLLILQGLAQASITSPSWLPGPFPLHSPGSLLLLPLSSWAPSANSILNLHLELGGRCVRGLHVSLPHQAVCTLNAGSFLSCVSSYPNA